MPMKPFPISASDPPSHTGNLPDVADCVVIGGGVIGVSTALYLARAGQKVVLLEKGRIAGEQSSRNWGWIRVQGRDAAEIPIALEARELWQDLAGQTDVDIGLTQGGVLYKARSDKEMAGFQTWLDQARPFGVETQLLDADGVAKLLPDAQTRWKGGLWTPSDMRAEPFLAVPALARLALRDGATIIEDCAVRLLEIEADQVTGVISEQGRIRCERVVIAGGAWSSLLLRRHGIRIPQLSVRATAAQTAPLPDVFQGGAVDDRLAFRRRADGGYTLAPEGFHELFVGPAALRAIRPYLSQIIADPWGTKFLPAAPKGFPDAWGTAQRWRADQISPFERMRVLNPAPNMARVRQISRDFAATFESITQAPIARAWAGMIDVLPDLVPVVDRAVAFSGLTIATGMSGHGFGIGPAFGRITADLVMGCDPGHDLSRFRLSRFSDGSALKPGHSL